LEEKEKRALINAINSSGTILEVQLYSILRKRFDEQMGSEPRAPFPPLLWNVGTPDGGRKEVDCLARENNCWFIFEAKSSVFDWYFFEFQEPELRRAKNSRILLPKVQHDNKVEMEDLPISIFMTSMGIEIKRNKEGKMSIEQATKGSKIYPKGEFIAERSDRGQIIQEACIQIIENVPWIIEKLDQRKELQQFDRIVPMVVTNANLFKVVLSQRSLNNRGMIDDIVGTEAIPFLSYELDWPLKCSLTDSGYLKWGYTSDLKSIIITKFDNLLGAMAAAKV
jgi:hypothetical protein